eukprot:gene19825-22534_t
MKEGQLWDGIGKIKLKPGIYYVGGIRDGILHGNGKITYTNNGTYLEGEFRWGKLWNAELRKIPNAAADGPNQGEQEGNDSVLRRWVRGRQVGGTEGASASDELDSLDSVHAERVVQKDGSVLEGEWRGDTFFGKQTSTDGKIMTGEFRNGKIWTGEGEIAGADQIGKNDDQIFTTPGTNGTGSFYNQASETDATSQVTFPDTRLNANTNVPEVDAAKASVSEASKSKVNRQKATKEEKDLQASEQTVHTSRGRKSHWMDLHPDAHAIPVAVTAADVLASRCQRFVTADNTVIEGEWRGEKFI